MPHAERSLADDPLAALFRGKRRWVRVTCELAVRCPAPGGDFGGLALDLSEGGVRIKMTDPGFYAWLDAGGGWFGNQDRLPRGFDLRLADGEVRRRARIVRVVPEEDGLVSLGLEFEEPLRPGEATLLGIPRARIAQAAELLRLDRVAGPESRTDLVLSGAAGLERTAQVAAVGPRCLLARLGPTPAAPLEVAEDLAGASCLGQLVRSGRIRWQGALDLVLCERWPDAPDHVALLFVASEDVPRAVRRVFVPGTPGGTAP